MISKKQHEYNTMLMKLKAEINNTATVLKNLKTSFKNYQRQENDITDEKGRPVSSEYATWHAAHKIKKYTNRLHKLIAIRTILDPDYDGRAQLKHKKVTDIYDELYNFWLDM